MQRLKKEKKKKKIKNRKKTFLYNETQSLRKKKGQAVVQPHNR